MTAQLLEMEMINTETFPVLQSVDAALDNEFSDSASLSPSGRSAPRPFSLLPYIEHVVGPMPDEGDEGLMNAYRRSIEGLYNICSLRKVELNETTSGNVEYVTTDVGVNRFWWTRKGVSGLTAKEADELACAAGVHPQDIWPTWWDETSEELGDLTDEKWAQFDQNRLRRNEERLTRFRLALASGE